MKHFIRDAIEGPMNDLAANVRNNTLETAAKVAKLYGAPEEAARRILMLRGTGRAALGAQEKGERE